jgi:hypothetical protein
MRSLLLNILPQTLMLIGLAGMAWIAARPESPFRSIINFERIILFLQKCRQIAGKNGMRLAEKSLRSAKILSMRLERFFSSRLEMLIANKKELESSSFWKSVRERKIKLRKLGSQGSSPSINTSESDEKNSEILARLSSKERNSPQN